MTVNVKGMAAYEFCHPRLFVILIPQYEGAILHLRLTSPPPFTSATVVLYTPKRTNRTGVGVLFTLSDWTMYSLFSPFGSGAQVGWGLMGRRDVPPHNETTTQNERDEGGWMKHRSREDYIDSHWLSSFCHHVFGYVCTNMYTHDFTQMFMRIYHYVDGFYFLLFWDFQIIEIFTQFFYYYHKRST